MVALTSYNLDHAPTVINAFTVPSVDRFPIPLVLGLQGGLVTNR